MSPEAEQNNRQNASYHEDEIDLVDLGVILVRHWRLIVVIVVLFMALGLFRALRRQPIYNYTASIQPAHYMTSDGRPMIVLSSESAIALLENGLIDEAIGQYASAHNINPRHFRIKAHSPERSQVVLLTGRGPEKLQEAYETIERTAAEFLAKSTAQLTATHRSELEASLARAKLQMTRLTDPQMVRVKKAELKQKLLSAQATVVNLTQQHAILVTKRANLSRSLKLYESMAKELYGYLAKARSAMLPGNAANTPAEAMTSMLLNNQLQQNLGQYTNIEEKITLTLPQQIAQVQASIADNEQQQLLQKAAVEQAQIQYDDFDTRHQREISAQLITIDNLQTGLENTQGVRLVAPPMRSAVPVGRSKRSTLVLVTFFGVFVALFAVFLVEFTGALRKRMTGKNDAI